MVSPQSFQLLLSDDLYCWGNLYETSPGWTWPSILLYTLFFIGGIIVIMSGFASTQVLIFMLNLVMAVLLSSWQLAIALAVIGLTAAPVVFKCMLGKPILLHSMSIPSLVGYGILLFGSVLIASHRLK